MKFLWSAKNNAFIPESMRSQYELAGWDLADCIPADEALVAEFMGEAPTGMMHVPGDDGMPEWGEIPENPVSLETHDA